ncbi:MULTISPECIES: BlaI/MecI/CopY family transcriptional regulator [unclassified Aureispira]|uniref:BlaI/MecI/CopY family transcriptional regulator n=1 Tax=unclassified Aureispira TaxID=2649989 RepID=UPI0006990459|nr:MULTISPECIES: BlaI/MecI/CopY family transcriptional regulator [unclassified Aureispira]WMX14222.1 BlaI/MecI/CopY family transcriptional regulator [Aureispira sp. CCB-E]
MKGLTKAEEQVMHHLWALKKAFLKDIVDAYQDPKPAYTTVSTVIRVLVKKKYIGFNTYGKTNEYYPLISQEEYFSGFFKGFFARFFNNSATRFTSFFAKDNELTIDELEEMKQIIEQQIADKKRFDK